MVEWTWTSVVGFSQPPCLSVEPVYPPPPVCSLLTDQSFSYYPLQDSAFKIEPVSIGPEPYTVYSILNTATTISRC
jgi:hypothetical protein